jgi:hypothetical protein
VTASTGAAGAFPAPAVITAPTSTTASPTKAE